MYYFMIIFFILSVKPDYKSNIRQVLKSIYLVLKKKSIHGKIKKYCIGTKLLTYIFLQLCIYESIF